MRYNLIYLLFGLLLVACNHKQKPVVAMQHNVNYTNEVILTDQQIHLANIHTDTIRSGWMETEVILTGTLNINGKRRSSISARVMGRVEKLYVKSPGDFVSIGMPVYELYSEDLNNAKQEYILAIERKKHFIEHSVIDFEEVIGSAKNKL